MRCGALALALALVVCGPAPARSEHQEAPEVVDVSGFHPKGGLAGVVEGDVTIERAGQAARSPRPEERLEKGDVVRVRGRGRAELLLNPGYFLRLSDDTEVALLDLSAENLKLKLSRGSAIVEVSLLDMVAAFGYAWNMRDADEGVYDLVTVLTPHGEIVLVEGGLYRLDVTASATEVRVAKGDADAEGHRVESGRRATVRGRAVSVVKFDRDEADAFEQWSHARSEALVRANAALESSDWYKQMRKSRGSHFEVEDTEWAEEARSRSTVSAVSGLVTFAEEGVAVRRGDAEWTTPVEGDRLRPGDRLRTGDASRAGVQLYPTCRLYLASRTEVVYLERPGGGITAEVARGSAVVVSRMEEALVTFAAPGIEYEIADEGTYRLNVAPGGSEMLVHRGKVRYGRRDAGGGKKVVVRGRGRTVASIGKGDHDGFDVWSAQRATEMPSSVGTAVALYRKRRADFGGMWYFEPSGAYTYVPGRWIFRSPYGGKYPIRFRS